MTADDLAEKVAAALCGPVIGTDANGYRLHLTSGQAFTLAVALLPLIREREAAAWDEGYHESDEFPHANPYAGSEGAE